MVSPPRSDHKLDLGPLPPASLPQIRASASASGSPADSTANALRYPLGNSMATVAGNAGPLNRSGAGSPSKDYGSRLFGKRAREIQAQEGVSPPVWGPPPAGSGHSTPLRETIPESPVSDEFPNLDPSSSQAQPISAQQRRARAGTVPSRFPVPNPLGTIGSSSPHRTPDAVHLDPLGSHLTQNGILSSSISPSQKTALLSRLRAGSTPQRASLLGSNSPFGPSYFSSSGWSSSAPRSRANTLQSLQSAADQPSPSLSSRDSFADTDVKTLDYLGLVDPPLLNMSGAADATVQNTLVASLAAAHMNRNANRLRSYSVNAKEKYADDDEQTADLYSDVYAPPITHSADVSAAQAAALREAVKQHNLEVQAFTQFASASRPRARTAGMVEAPSRGMIRNYLPTPSRLEQAFSAQDLSDDGEPAMGDLVDSVTQMHLQPQSNEDLPADSPTRALWLGNIPPSTTTSSLEVIFRPFGSIESSRVLTHKGCGFVNFDDVASAVQAKATLHNREIFPGNGIVRIGYAKAPSPGTTPGMTEGYQAQNDDPFRSDTAALASSNSLRPNVDIHAETAAAALKTPKLRDLRGELNAIAAELGAAPDEQVQIGHLIDNAISYDLYHNEIPPVADSNPERMYDAPKLREIRKRIDANPGSQAEIESIALDMLPEIAELSSDYLGNTVVQKLFDYCSDPVKEQMLAHIAPRLAEIGVHKNGTWAAQKIIDVARTPAQMEMIVAALRPYAVQLFLDQYGNYVMQCCLRFGSPMNDFIFDAMLQKLWEIAQGRFGARAMRACLESHFSTKNQQRMLASAIALHSVQLATNTNGALLLTWFLDTCTFPRRRAVLAPRLITHVVHLSTHKVAYLTVLKILNQRNEPDAREEMVRGLFLSPDLKTLQDVLSDQTCGATFVYKVLATPFFDEKLRPQVHENVKNVLLRLKAQPQQGYKRLMDEVGLPTRGAASSRDQSRTRSVSRGRMADGHVPHMSNQSPYRVHPQVEQLMAGSANRATSVDSSAYDSYVANNGMAPSYTHTPPLGVMHPVTAQQMQYQQQLMAQQQSVGRGGYYGSPAMPMNGFGTPVQAMDPFGRPALNGSPLPGGIGLASPMPGHMGPNYAPPGFGGMNMPAGMYGAQYSPGYYAPQQQQQPQGPNGQRRRGQQ